MIQKNQTNNIVICSKCNKRMISIRYLSRKSAEKRIRFFGVTKVISDIKICDDPSHPRRMVIMNTEIDISATP